MEFVKFKELEDKIKYLINEYAILKKKNQALEELLKNKGVELEEANTKIKLLNEERSNVRTKVDSLLDLFQGINLNTE